MNIFYMIFIFPLVSGMKFILGLSYDIIGSYGLSIVIMSIVVNTVLLPLYYLAEKWQNRERQIQRKMSPEIKEINKTYKGEEKYNKTVEIYKKYNYHPVYSFRTSFGFLIQVPFFIAAYTLLSKYEPFNGISFLFIDNLSEPDSLLTIGAFSINILPFVMTLFNLLSSFVYTKGLTKGEQYKLFFMALLFLFLLYTSSSALVFYWTLNNVYSLFKNVIHNPVKQNI